MRDLLDRPAEEWEIERRRIPNEGWGAQYLAAMTAEGGWPKGRWTDTVWTLLVLMDLGFPPDHPQVVDAAWAFLEQNLSPSRAGDEGWLLQRVDLCHLGFWLRIGAYFGWDSARLSLLAGTVLRAQMADGGWNCRVRNYPETSHSSFHTTFNVLEGLRGAAEVGLIDSATFRASEERALEFMLAHHLYRSDRTGEVIHERFTHLTFPSHWHYTVLRGLDYLRRCSEITDPRLDDPIALLVSRRRENGQWPVEKRIPGKTLVEFERMGGDSRWNTLRALRVVKARAMGTATAPPDAG
jgi:hypothetical protein